jgi:hypothetical protein
MPTNPADPTFIEAARGYLDLILVYPKNTLHFGIAAGVLVFVLAYVFPKIESALDASQATTDKGWIMAILAPVLLIIAAAALRVSVLPSINGPGTRNVVLIAGVILALLIVVVPITKFLFGSTYVSSLLACGITFFCGAVAVLITYGGFKAFSLGEHAVNVNEGRKEAIKLQE